MRRHRPENGQTPTQEISLGALLSIWSFQLEFEMAIHPCLLVSGSVPSLGRPQGPTPKDPRLHCLTFSRS